MQQNTNRLRSLALTAAAGLCVAAALSGCRQEDGDGRAVDEALITLPASNDPAGSVRSLASIDTEGRDSLGVASSALRGVASQRQSIDSAAAMQDAVRAVSRRLTPVRDALSRYTSLSAKAAGILENDGEESLRAARSRAAAVASEIETQSAGLDELTEQRDELVSAIAEFRSRALGFRDEAAGLETTASMGTATEAAELAPRIRGLTRTADGLDLQASRLQAQVDVLLPRISEAERRNEGLREQRRLALAEIESIEDARRASERSARETAAEASEKADEIATLVDAVTGPEGLAAVEAASEEALGHLSAAARDAGRTRGGSGTRVGPAKLVSAKANRRAAELTLDLARLHADIAAAMASLADAEPALDEASRYAGLAEASTAKAAELRASAAELFGRAAGDFRGARVRGDAGSALDSVIETLEAQAESLANEAGENGAGMNGAGE